jgi:mannitol 2-dehydrogenase
MRPRYARSDLSPGIVHIGLGNFHRAHQAWYLHRLMQQGQALDWGIVGAGVRSYDQEMREKLLSQDCLSTLVELSPEGRTAEVIGSMVDYVPVLPGNAPLIAQMSDPAIRIVSLTVTEGGYFIDPASGGFDGGHDDMRHDAVHVAAPKTAFGAIVAALRERRAAGEAPFTLQSCDNLKGNGDVLRQTIVLLAEMSDPSLAAWINDHAAFPSAMVDCIVPATGPREIAEARAFGIEDAAPVTHENFRQWVIEDHFCAGRPVWENAGVTLTKNVHPFETMKIRVLNAGHQVLANVSEVLSLPTIASAMQDADVSRFFRKVEVEEISPFVAPAPGMKADAYLSIIEERFANPAIHDTIRRVAFDGSSRHTEFVLPIVRDALAAGHSVRGLALVEALWARMCAGQREDGTVIDANDPFWDQLSYTANAARQQPSLWLDQGQIYGDLANNPRFAAPFADWLSRLWSEGSRAVLQSYLRD